MPAGKDEKCGQCMYTVPEGANVCGMCGAVCEEFNDQSVEAKIQAGIIGLIAGAVLGLLVQIPFTDAHPWMFWLATIAGPMIGWSAGLDKNRWRR